ncbi:universal stress protein [Bacillus piscicola]|uniref:universal stress protein n=1 Tax=Bacillus piscicola TaxID=1632684 RepID=UPI001F08C11A|nr:universal stress protein [Bacillus piscicola]
MAVYQNILVAVDGSDESKRALSKAIDLAGSSDAHLIIAHVVDTRALATIEQYNNTVISQAEDYGEKLLQDHEKEAKEAGVEKVTTVIEHGTPKGKIPRGLAEEYKADVVVAGATGLNAVERLFIGSVSEAIVRHAPCDVLIVRNR